MNPSQEKLFRTIMTTIHEHTVGDSLTALLYVVTYVAARAGMPREEFLKGCGEAYDFARSHLETQDGDA